VVFFFFSSRRRHTRSYGDWSSDVCSSDLEAQHQMIEPQNEKARGGTDDQVQLYAGVAAEKRDEPEQGGTFGAGDDQPAEDLADEIGRASCRERVERSVAAGTVTGKGRRDK